MKYYPSCILLLFLILSSLISAYGTRSLNFMEGSLPGEGFSPLMLGALLALLSLIELINTIRKSTADDKKLNKIQVYRILSFFAAVVVTVLAGYLIIGLLPALAIFLYFSFRVWNKLTFKSASINSIVIIVAVYLIFSVCLNVQMPWGIFWS